MTRKLVLTEADEQAWRDYEDANKAAHEQYQAMPTAFRHAHVELLR